MKLQLPHRLLALAFALPVLACLSTASAQELDIVLEAPEAVRPLLQRHLRILRPEQVRPEAAADRVALARRARREVAELLATEGYFAPEVDVVRKRGEPWRLLVDPGPRTVVREVGIAFEGDLAFDRGSRTARRQALRDDWLLSPGKPFRQEEWDSAKQRLLDEVSSRDYAAARIAASRAEIDPLRAQASLNVTVDSGPRFRLGPLQVSGLRDLPADVVDRFSTLHEGEPFDRERLLEFQSELQNTPHFASVIVDIDRDPALADAAPVRVEVSEANPRRLSLGAGLSSNTGVRGEFAYGNSNWLGKAWELSTGIRLEQRRQSAYADVFLPPSRARYRDSFGVAIEQSDLQGLKTNTQAVGVARNRTRGPIDTQLALRLQHERLQPAGSDASSRNAFTVNWTWRKREVDNLLDPRRGDVLEAQVGGGMQLSGERQRFGRLYGRYVHYQPVAERDVVILRGELGVTFAPSREGVPQDFLFRTGGAQTVRGYPYQSLGVSEGDATVGGRYLATASAEYVHWFRPQWGVAAFLDGGDAFDERNAFSGKLGYGLGARWRSPGGPLALDLAYGDADGKLRLHFAIAIAF